MPKPSRQVDDFRSLLTDALGWSEVIIAINVDVREFSPFSEDAESVEAALFIKRIYQEIIDRFFSEAPFAKPTGDGLMIVVPVDPVDEATLKQRLNYAVATALKLVREFGDLCDGDSLINFPVPRRVGIGMARGAACRLQSGDHVFDYCGTVLNLASRMMDLARPEGVVFDDTFGLPLLHKRYRDQFAAGTAYIRGLAEKEPMPVFITPEFTSIPPAAKKPLSGVELKHTVLLDLPLKEMADLGHFVAWLPERPSDTSRIRLAYEHPKVESGRKRHATLWSWDDLGQTEYSYGEEARGPFIRFNAQAIVKKCVARGVRSNWPVRVRFHYVI